jgi:hypothetical protein
MKVRSYLAEKDPDLFVILPINVIPEDLAPQVETVTGELTPFKEFELSPNEPRIGVNTRKALEDIEKHGYHFAKIKLEFKVTEQS